jgi:hypothetical protein
VPCLCDSNGCCQTTEASTYDGDMELRLRGGVRRYWCVIHCCERFDVDGGRVVIV